MRQRPRQSLLHPVLLAVAVLAAVPGARAETAPLQLPTWKVLEYEQKAFFVTARSRVEITAGSEDGADWQLKASSSVASNSEEVELTMAAADGRALHRTRLSQGKGRRFKTFTFTPEHILRVRHDPADNSTLPPCQWPVSSRHEISYPPLAADKVVTDAYALLALADEFRTSADAPAEVVVNTEFNFYQVLMTRSDGPAIETDISVTGGPAIAGNRQTQAVRLQVSPLGEQADKPDFSLLGLNRDITVLYDVSSGLPLQLSGRAPRIGDTRINLKSVTLRTPAP